MTRFLTSLTGWYCVLVLFVATNTPAAPAGVVFVEPTILGVRYSQIAQFVGDVKQLRQASEDFTQEIKTARANFWTTFPDKPGHAEAAKQFDDLLCQKDANYFLLAITEGVDGPASSVLQKLGGKIDGGIPLIASGAFRDWIDAIRYRMGARKHENAFTGASDNPDVVSPFLDPTGFEKAVQASSGRLEAYRRLRDWAEFDASGLDLSKFISPKSYALRMCEEANNFEHVDPPAQNDDPGQLVKQLYDAYCNAFDESTVLAAAKAVFALPKNAIGDLKTDVETVNTGDGLVTTNSASLAFLGTMLQHDARAFAIGLLYSETPLAGPDAWKQSVDGYVALTRQYGQASVVAAASRIKAIPANGDAVFVCDDGQEMQPCKLFRTLLANPKMALPSGKTFHIDASQVTADAVKDQRGRVTVRGVVEHASSVMEQGSPWLYIHFENAPDFIVHSTDAWNFVKAFGKDMSGMNKKTIEVSGTFTIRTGTDDGQSYHVDLQLYDAHNLVVVDASTPANSTVVIPVTQDASPNAAVAAPMPVAATPSTIDLPAAPATPLPPAAPVATPQQIPVPGSSLLLQAIPVGHVHAHAGTFDPLVAASPDGQHALVIVFQGTKLQALFDGQPGPIVGSVKPYEVGGIYAGQPQAYKTPAFSADGKHVMFIAEMPGGTKSVVVDTQASSPLNDVRWIHWAPVGDRYAYYGQGGAGIVIGDSGTQTSYRSASIPQFTADGQHLLVAAVVGPKNMNLLVDGKPVGPAYRSITNIRSSANGSRMLFVAQGDQSEDSFVVDNQSAGPSAPHVGDVVVSADGHRAAYVKIGEKTSCVVDNGRPGTEYASCTNLRLSDNGATLMYSVPGADQSQVLVVNGKEYGPFRSVNKGYGFEGGHWAATFSPLDGGSSATLDGRFYHLPLRNTGDTVTFIGGGRIVVSGYDDHFKQCALIDPAAPKGSKIKIADDVIVSANGQHVAKVLRVRTPGSQDIHEQVVVDDGPPGKTYQNIRNLAVSDDGKHVAYVAFGPVPFGKDADRVVFDGIDDPNHGPAIRDLKLSPDGHHAAYLLDGSEPAVVVDGVKTPLLGTVAMLDVKENEVSYVHFDPEGSLHFAASLHGELNLCSYSASSLSSLPGLAQSTVGKPGLSVLKEFEMPTTGNPCLKYALFGADDTIYGITNGMGANKQGTLFSIKTDGSSYTVLHEFANAPHEGHDPKMIVLAPDGSIFGCEQYDDPEKNDPKNVVFRYDPVTKKFSSFDADVKSLAGVTGSGYLVGISPQMMAKMDDGNYENLTPVVVCTSDGRRSKSSQPKLVSDCMILGSQQALYGICNSSYLKSVAAPQAGVADLHSFRNEPGAHPSNNLFIDSSGVIFGYSTDGGASNGGFIYRINLDGSGYTKLAEFDTNAALIAMTVADNGLIYGLQRGDDSSPLNAELFSIPKAGGAMTKIDAAPGSVLDASMLYHAGTLYYLTPSAVVKDQLVGAPPSAASTALPEAAGAGWDVLTPSSASNDAPAPAAQSAMASSPPPTAAMPVAGPAATPAPAPGPSVKFADGVSQQLAPAVTYVYLSASSTGRTSAQNMAALTPKLMAAVQAGQIKPTGMLTYETHGVNASPDAPCTIEVGIPVAPGSATPVGFKVATVPAHNVAAMTATGSPDQLPAAFGRLYTQVVGHHLPVTDANRFHPDELASCKPL